MKGFAVLVFAIALTASPCLCGDNKALDELMSKIEAADAKITTLKFRFDQTITYKLTREKQSNSGEVAFKKPSSIRIKQKNPIEQLIITNGKKVWVYTPSYNQVIVDSWKKWSSNSMIPPSVLNFGDTWSDLKKKYKFTYLGKTGDEELIELVPLKDDIFSMKFWINSRTYFPDRVDLSGENIIVETKISAYELNPKIDTKLFEFKAPSGADVLSIP
ncbi:MAG: outer membrane lipoprotein carrier protein LolA [Endomicrobiales bacterium]|nr:outer membrane lipoprotein carrier protein LolA [Endomicrobiales bacterium]